MGLQPADSARSNVTAGLLGTHRIRLWPVFDPAQTRAGYSHRVIGPVDDISLHAPAVSNAHQAERTRCGCAGMVSQTSQRVNFHDAEIWRMAFSTSFNPTVHWSWACSWSSAYPNK